MNIALSFGKSSIQGLYFIGLISLSLITTLLHLYFSGYLVCDSILRVKNHYNHGAMWSVNNNAFKIDLPPYLGLHLILNVELLQPSNLKAEILSIHK